MAMPSDEYETALAEQERIAANASRVPADPQPRPTREGREGDSQPLPEGNDLPVMHALVAEELPGKLMLRLRLGIERYGQPLQPFNGRNAAADAEEETLDLLVYLRQARFEMDTMRKSLIAARSYVAKGECTEYDGVPERGGPCWTCQSQEDRCPKAGLLELIDLVAKVTT